MCVFEHTGTTQQAQNCTRQRVKMKCKNIVKVILTIFLNHILHILIKYVRYDLNTCYCSVVYPVLIEQRSVTSFKLC